MSPHGQLKGGNEVVECLQGSLVLGQFIDTEGKGNGQGPN